MPNNRKTYKLGDIADIQNGYAFKAAELVDKGIPVIKIKNIISPNVSIEDVSYYNGKLTDNIKRYIIEKGDFLISMTGSTVNVMSSAVGKMGRYRLDDRSLINQRVGKIYLTKPDIASFEYVCQYLNRYEIHYNLALNATGSANQANISPAQIKDIEISLPSLEEQKSIAAILSAIDDKIENNLAINKTLEEMAMALYNHWFVDFGPFQDGEFVESELGRIPMGWEVKRLDEICNITIGRTPPRKEPKWFSQNEGVKWISIKDIGNSGIYISKTSEYLSEEAIKKFNVPVINPNTVILSFKLTVGRVAISSERMLSNEAIAHLNRKDSEIPVEYIYSYLKLFDYNSLGSTSSIATAVNTQTIKAMKIIIPDKKLLNSYFEKVNTIFEQIKINQNENQTLTQLRDTLLPKLISGEVRLKAFREENEKRA
ncbi:restriction endonuclease subunit S [Flavobacterium sp.]|jgi:type I restriction enzyme S subunit|uniref:restriction endonuclease subunit S n=1 Tax=Flavobacterium sp. TaxID=239 RepID=UPI0022BD603E|nr:restriction endonuclease subunit S [Flavobacterium sp.]MCZ8145831.1 restriction endonuclease subunit S [Flavobacterium sp.]MCZ8366417.1 restriction endonuclease subunit S [Flavobacterium sp.]